MSVIPDTTLVICTRERPRLVAETIQSIVSGTALPSEIMVIDQSSQRNDALSAMARSQDCRIRYIHAAGRGVCWARNRGVSESRGKIVAFTDDDVLASDGWFEALVRPLVEGDRRAVITGPLLPAAPEVPGGFQLALRNGAQPEVFTRPGPRDVLVSANMAIPRRVLEEVGPFDLRLGPGTPYPAAEENDYGLRLLRHGCTIHYTPEAHLYHRLWREPREYLALRWRYGLGQGGFYGKWLLTGDAYPRRRLLIQLSHYAVRLPWRLVREPRRAAGDAVFVAGLLYGTGRWLTRRPELGQDT